MMNQFSGSSRDTVPSAKTNRLDGGSVQAVEDKARIRKAVSRARRRIPVFSR